MCAGVVIGITYTGRICFECRYCKVTDISGNTVQKAHINDDLIINFKDELELKNAIL